MCVVPLVYKVVGGGGEIIVGWRDTGVDEEVEAGIGSSQLYVREQFLTEVHTVGEIRDRIREAAGAVKCDGGVKTSRSSDGAVWNLLGFKERLKNCFIPDHAAHLQKDVSI